MPNPIEDRLSSTLASWIHDHRPAGFPNAATLPIHVARRDEIRVHPCVVLNTSEAKPVSDLTHSARVKLDVHVFSQVDDTPAETQAEWAGQRIAEIGLRIADYLWNSQVSPMDTAQFKARTMAWGLRIIRLVEALPHGQTASVMGRQLLQCGTSVGANYRAAARAKSTPDFISKMGTVGEECDESLYWMEMLDGSGLLDITRMAELMAEGNESLAMVVASINTAHRKR